MNLKKRGTAGILMAGLFLMLIPGGHVVAAEGGPFSDVSVSNSFAHVLSYLKEKNIVNGYPDGSFHPDQIVSRAEALSMIIKSTGKKNELIKKKAAESDESFEDVSDTVWFHDVVIYSKDADIISSKGTKFYPDQPLTVVDGLSIIFKSDLPDIDELKNASEIDPPSVAQDAWYRQNIQLAMHLGMISQKPNGEFVWKLDKSLTRGELALLLYRYHKAQGGTRFGYASWYGDGLSKRKLDKNASYASQYLTAAHRTLPMGTLVKATNMWTGDSVTVVINDRGPYIKGRVLDLSKTAFSKIASPGSGTALIEYDPLP